MKTCKIAPYVAQNAPARTKQILKAINDQVLSYLKGYGIGAHGNPAKNDSQAARSRIAVLRDTRMPAVLLECLFIDNAKENELLRDQKFLDGLAKSIVKGLAVALGLKKKVTKPKPMYRVVVDDKEVMDTAYHSKILDEVLNGLEKKVNQISIKKLD
ncbi:N-acetylmuramoyl-L-alanine amidase [Laceyella tengchongensis]|uniref:N-acetylmuramoyl-L-alanine amidase n=1 Tax=Laceyella tengchongensis TaxID=574699 RepID=A0AA45WSG9_9BACL|nr:N-acetylmuramoyl-L-alanine amidase [Laceyella tengchongensis]